MVFAMVAQVMPVRKNGLYVIGIFLHPFSGHEDGDLHIMFFENGKEVTADTSASDMCEILKEVFNSDSFEYRGITGKCEDNEKSYISWSEDGTVVKEAIKYIVKEKNA